MLKHRIIPIILLDGFSVLKTQNFNTRRNLGSPITVMRTFESRNVDEMIILDIDASRQGRTFDYWLAKDISQDCFMPLTFGGGVKSCDDIENMLAAGADKVSINSAAITDPDFIREAVKVFGSQCIVISIDITSETEFLSSPQSLTHKNLSDFLKHMEDLDVGEFLITDVNNEGSLKGPNLDLSRKITNVVKKPVIFAGGVAKPDDCVDLIKTGKADAIGCSSIFFFTNFTPNDCRSALRFHNIPARKT